MSKLILYTVQSDYMDPNDFSVADKSGLSEYLGYRPIFCTALDPNSLLESWFRVYIASHSHSDIIYIFEMDSEDVIPYNFIDFGNKCIDNISSISDFDAILNGKDVKMTNFLVKEIPDTALKLPLKYFFSDAGSKELLKIIDPDHTPFSYKATRYLQNLHSNYQDIVKQIEIESTIGNNQNEGFNKAYSILNMAGLFPFLYCVAFHYNLDKIPFAMSILEGSITYLNNLNNSLDLWDSSSEQTKFTYADFYGMREDFMNLLNSAYKNRIEQLAKYLGISRNDECMCGSHKKLKKCCVNKNLDSYFFRK